MWIIFSFCSGEIDAMFLIQIANIFPVNNLYFDLGFSFLMIARLPESEYINYPSSL